MSSEDNALLEVGPLPKNNEVAFEVINTENHDHFETDNDGDGIVGVVPKLPEFNHPNNQQTFVKARIRTPAKSPRMEHYRLSLLSF